MISFIVQSAENFCIHQIGAPHSIQQFPSKMRTLIAYLDIKDTIGKEYRVYVGCDDILIQCITAIFLGEELSNRETLSDMLLEATNMIVGSAKVLVEEKLASSFTILTPHLQEDTPFTADTHYTFRVAEGEMMIAIKAL